MASIKLPHFGAIDSSALDEYYDAEVNYNDTLIQVDLNFEGKTIEEQRLQVAARFIENIRVHDLNNKKRIEEDFNDEEGDTVRTYLEDHLEELATDDIDDLIGPGKKNDEKPLLLMKKLQLVRVGLYPDSTDQFAIFDYSIGSELTDHLVVIFTDENGNLDYMTIES